MGDCYGNSAGALSLFPQPSSRRAPVKPPCEVCGAPSVKRRRCSRHAQALRLNRAPKGSDPLCTIEGCGRRHHARGWCSMHYQRWKAHGDPLALTQRYTYGARVKPPTVEPTTLVTVRLPRDLRARVEYAAALAGVPLATHLRAVIEAAHR